MKYESVDRIQNVLAESVFDHTKDSKKASGRALGTLVEIITFYLLKSWGFEHCVSIESSLAEYGNSEITHNVEYSLHPILTDTRIKIKGLNYPITSKKIISQLKNADFSFTDFQSTNNTFLRFPL